MSELRPCPFCGAVPIMDPASWIPTTNPRYARIYPRDCSCGIVALPEGGGITVEMWNRRAPDRAALVEVARRGLATYGYVTGTDEQRTEVAERIVSEYLDEQENP